MGCVQAPSGQVTAQLVAPWQSIEVVQPPGGQVIRQSIPFGQVIGWSQGEHAEPQSKTQVPSWHAPPAFRQSAQLPPASAGPQAGPVLPSVAGIPASLLLPDTPP